MARNKFYFTYLLTYIEQNVIIGIKIAPLLSILSLTLFRILVLSVSLVYL